jgi:DNA invertase Pin-like site-specific DNA recombinase
MSRDPKTAAHCAIYTRKSSEEGLEQSFNSLDAQREACEAFIASQRHEGWRAMPTRYDDGGYSGGTIERPALKRLLDDIAANKINVIVVYKVDRLTRSLADFAKIVEALDGHGVSFVSVTQQFNTTTSMGRLTLNVLLSFAQFEREVTGERIRDKIAASKRKGIWMGGPVPIGYDLAARKLVPNTKEAALVCKIFSLYLELGCVSRLAVRLAREKIRSKVWITKAGIRLGGNAFARGALYDLLQNRLYIGEIRHRDQWYAGEHQGIVPRKLWDDVQARMSGNRKKRHDHIRERSSSLLTGLLVDANGHRYTPSFTFKKRRRYRYYVSQLAIKNPATKSLGPIRLPAREIESRITERLLSFLKSDAEVFDRLGASAESPAASGQLVAAARKLALRWPALRSEQLRDLLASFLRRIIVQENNIEVLISRAELRQVLEKGEDFVPTSLDRPHKSVHPDDLICLTIDAKLKRSGGEVHLVVPPHSGGAPSPQPNPSLMKAVARARSWYERVLEGKSSNQRSLTLHAGLTRRYIGKVFGCAFLAPDIVEAILEGRQPRVECTVHPAFEIVTRHVGPPINRDYGAEPIPFG